MKLGHEVLLCVSISEDLCSPLPFAELVDSEMKCAKLASNLFPYISCICRFTLGELRPLAEKKDCIFKTPYRAEYSSAAQHVQHE